MAVAGFKVAVNHCLRPFQNIPIAIYTDIPLAHIKCIPDESGISLKGHQGLQQQDFLEAIEAGVKQFLDFAGKPSFKCKFEIKLFSHPNIKSADHWTISVLTAIAGSLNEWWHHPLEKNDVLTWLLQYCQLEDADIICACTYGGIMSHIGFRPFRIYQPKGLFFQFETIAASESVCIPAAVIPLFIPAMERSDFNSIHDLLRLVHPAGDIQESYLGILDLPDNETRLHVFNISTPDLPKVSNQQQLSAVFGIDSQGYTVI